MSVIIFSAFTYIAVAKVASSSLNSDTNFVSNIKNQTTNIPPEYELAKGIIRNGTLSFGTAENPIVYEQINSSYMFEGDIILDNPPGEKGDRAAVDGFFASNLWPNGIIPYLIDESIPNKDRINKAMQLWEDKTPINFVAISESNKFNYTDYVLFKRTVSDTCKSSIGRIGGEQSLHVTDQCPTGTIIHEIGHTIGLWHEQTRGDRDEYIQIRSNYVIDGKEHNFDQETCVQSITNTVDCERPVDVGPYDYCSIMHYHPMAFSKYPWDESAATMISKHEVIDCQIGQRETVSEGDIGAIKYIYPDLQENEIVPESNNFQGLSTEQTCPQQFSLFGDCGVTGNPDEARNSTGIINNGTSLAIDN